MKLVVCLLLAGFLLALHGLKQQVVRSALSLRMSSASSGSSSYFYSQKTLESIGLNSKMVSILNSMQITRPSKVQALSFTSITSGVHAVLGDQTGSGKTLAYLLPIIQKMDEDLMTGKLSRSPERSPYIVIMTPTQELASQVSSVVKSLANALKFRTACFTSNNDFDSEHKKMRLGSEVLVATPGRVMELLKRGEVSLDKVRVMVLDEVDVLFQDTSFPLPPIGQACPSTTQFIFASATLPQAVIQQITSEFSGVEILSGPGLHRVAPNVEEVLIDCSGPNSQQRALMSVAMNKEKALMQALLDVRSERTLIFCNTIEQSRIVENLLSRSDRAQRTRVVLPYHSAVDPQTRDSNLAAFSRPLLKVPHILICTDRASRGMDFDRSFVDHVVLFDFPREPSEYLRRVGRTGRAGRSGRVTVLAYGRQVEAAKAVIRASKDGKKIEPDSVRNLAVGGEEEESVRRSLEEEENALFEAKEKSRMFHLKRGVIPRKR